MKLELKHIVGYLPYGLKVKSINIFENDPVFELSLETGQKTASISWMLRDKFKPILRPLSDLTKEIEEDVIIYNKLSRRSQSDFAYEVPSILKWSYEDIQVLLEYHFDIHGLIEKGLAIDKNTLP